MLTSFDWVTDDRGLDALREDWTQLDAGDAPGTIFRSWEWQASWWRTLGRERPQRRALRVLVARDGTGQVRAILPLYLEDAPIARVLPRRRVRLLADGVVGSDYLGLVAPAAEVPLIAREVAAHLAADPLLRQVDLLELDGLLAGDPLAAALASSLTDAAYGEVTVAPRHVCPHARLDQQDFAGYLDARPNGFGRQLRARRRALEQQQGFRLDVHASPDAVTGALDTLFVLHRARWAEEGGSDAFTSAGVEAFHRAAARALAERGWARLAVLSVGGEAVAAAYGFTRAGRFAYYQAGIRPAWRRRSAGTVVLGELLRLAFDEGLVEFDFLRGDEPYKRIWSDQLRRLTTLRAHPATARGRRAAGAARAIALARSAARRALPEVVARPLRHLARRVAR